MTLPSTCPTAPLWPCAGVWCGAVSGADPAAALLLEVMQDPGLEARYLQGVLPLVAEVKVGRTWAETH